MIPLFCQTGFSTRVKIKNNIIYRRSNSRHCEYVNKSFFAFLIKCFLIGISKRVRKEVIPFYPQRIFLINHKKILFLIISTKKKKLSTVYPQRLFSLRIRISIFFWRLRLDFNSSLIFSKPLMTVE